MKVTKCQIYDKILNDEKVLEIESKEPSIQALP